LVSAFSLGLASVLIAIGLSVVYALQWLDCHADTLRERLPSHGDFLQHLPTASSIAVIFVGAVLIACAVA